MAPLTRLITRTQLWRDHLLGRHIPQHLKEVAA